MKILVDINNKILKVLENDRSIFKGEQSADKLILYINQQLVNEYPVITGLLSNGRRIGPFTTDSSYGTETIEETTYTTAEFTLSKENGFTLTEGTTEITIWIYKTKDTEVISKTAIGNITFNVVNTTSFNDGDIIISGDVEGTVVNIKVELKNLQSVVNELNTKVSNIRTIDMGTFSTNRPIEDGLKEFFIAAENLNLDYYDNRIFIGMVADTKVMAIGQAGGDLAVYTEKFEQYIVGYDDDDLLAVRHEPSKVRNVGAFETSTIGDGLKQFAKEVERLHNLIFKYNTTTCLYTGEIAGDIPVFTWYNGDEEMKVLTPNTAYKVSNLFDEENITITDISSYSKTEVDNKLTRSKLISTIGNATETLAGVMSAEDKKNLNTLVALLQDDENNIVDTINEVLAIFEQYPEGANLVALLGGKVDKIDVYTKPEIDNLLAGKVNMNTYNAKVEELEENISDLDNIKIEIDSLTAKNNIKNYQEVLWLGSDEIPEIPTQLPFGSSTDLITFLEGLKNLWSDIDSNLIEQYGYDRVVFLGYVNSIKKMVKCTIRYYESSGTYAINVHSSIYKNNVKECISLNTNKRYKLVNDTYTTPQEPSYFLEETSGYSKSEVDNLIAGAGGESLVIDMGTYTNDSNEEALKELFVSIKNKALPITTNYIYTAKVNGFKVKGMFNNISLKLDTNLQENYNEVKYEVYYDDEDNLLVKKYFVPTADDVGSVYLEFGDKYINLLPEEGRMEMYDGRQYCSISPYSIAVNEEGNSYEIDWKRVHQASKHIIMQTVTREVEDYDSSGIFEFVIDESVNTYFPLNIIIWRNGKYYDEFRIVYNINDNTFSILDLNGEIFLNYSQLIDGVNLGGLNEDQCIWFIIGKYCQVGDIIEIMHAMYGNGSPYYSI